MHHKHVVKLKILKHLLNTKYMLAPVLKAGQKNERNKHKYSNKYRIIHANYWLLYAWREKFLLFKSNLYNHCLSEELEKGFPTKPTYSTFNRKKNNAFFMYLLHWLERGLMYSANHKGIRLLCFILLKRFIYINAIISGTWRSG